MALDTTQYATTVLGRGDVPITTYAPNTTLGYSNDTIAAIPGLSDAINGRNGNQTLQDAMANPTQWVEQNHLFNALGNGDQNSIDESFKFLASQGVDANTIQNDLTNYANYIQQSSASGMFGDSFIGNVLNTVTSPENVAALMANAIVPGSGALVKTIEDASGGKQNLTNDLVSMAVSAYNPGSSTTSNIASNISNYTGLPSEIAKDVTTGALTTAANLAQGQNLQNSLASGTVGAINMGLGDAAASINPYTTTGPAPVSTIDTSQLPSALNDIPPTPTNAPLSDTYALSGTSDGLGLQATSTDGLTAPDSPNLTAMGGGQGLTVDTSGGVLSQMGVTPPNSQVVMGDPNSFINDPSVTGVAQQTTDQLSKLDKSGNNVITTTANPETGQVSTILTPATLPNNPLADSTVGTSTSTGGKSTTSGGSSSSPIDSVASSVSGGSGGSSSSSAPSSPLGSSAYNPLTAGLLSTGTVLNKSPLEQALGANEAQLDPTQLNQIYSQNLNPYMPQNISEGTSDIKFSKDGGSMGGLGHYEHKPEFITGHTGYYAQGGGTGQSDDIPALLKDGDYVMDADIVAALGDGSNKAGAEALHHFMSQFPHKHYENHSQGGHINAMIADGEFVFPASLVTALGGGSNKEGAKKLDEMREKIREHKRSASANKIPPKAKSPLSYMEKK